MRDVYYFNPTCEMAVANGTFSYTPPKHLLEFEKDLALLPIAFADKDDFLLINNPPSKKHQDILSNSGFEIPTFTNLSELENREVHLRSLEPWGWSPSTHHFLNKLKSKCIGDFVNSPVYDWSDEHLALFNRKTSNKFLIEYLNSFHHHFLCGKEDIGIELYNIESIVNHMNNGYQYVFKAPYSSSGRGIQMIRKEKLNASNKQWIKGILDQQKAIIVEPLLNKIADLSFHFEIKKSSNIKYLGYSFFQTNSNGQYRGTYLNPELSNFFQKNIELLIDEILQIIPSDLQALLSNSIYNHLYEGFIGIDALLFEKDGNIFFQPCIEINCRKNMGVLSFFIQKKIHQFAKGKFEIYFDKRGNYYEYTENMQKKYPLIKIDNQICSGFLSLTEPDKNQKTGAFILLHR